MRFSINPPKVLSVNSDKVDMKKNTTIQIICLIGLVLSNVSCVINASISDLGSKASSNLSNTDASPVIKMDKISVDLTQVTLTEGSVAVINVAVNPVRTVDTVINLNLSSSSTAIRFNPIPSQITIPAGLTSKSVILNTIDDSIVQNQEIWYFTITSVDPSIQADPGQLVITLNDNDGGYIPNSGPTTPIPTLLKEFNLMPAQNALLGINFNGKLIYAGTDAANGKELWISDGTALGTYLLKDINPGTGSSSPSSFYKDATSTYVYFVAKTASEGRELWRTDGTPSGTILLKDIEPGIGDSSIGFEATKGNLVIFSATTTSEGENFYVTDGSIAGTSLLKDIYPGTEKIYQYSNFVNFNGFIYFSVTSSTTYMTQLWKTDGTSAGTTLVLSSDSRGYSCTTINALRVLTSKIIFTGNCGPEGQELFATDGISSTNTVLLKDISTFYPSSYATATSFILNSKMVFTVSTDDNASNGIWYTDGTPSGTTKVLMTPSLNNFFDVINNKLVFSGTSSGDYELWVTDGTTTTLLKDINPGSTGSSPTYIATIGNKIYFTANSPTEGTELWVTDGTTAGTNIVKDIYPGTVSTNILNATAVGNNLVFRASHPSYGSELWITDGTTAGTGLLKDTNPGVKSSGPTAAIAMDNTHFFFGAYNPVTQFPTLFFSDMTTNGTIGINHSMIESGDSRTASFSLFNGLVYFDAMDDATGNPLWATDGTTAGTSKIKDLNPNITCSDFTAINTLNGSMFFAATTDTNGKELIISDGTTSGTQVLKDIEPGTGNAIYGYTPIITTSANKFFFAAATTAAGSELWITDLTSAGTTLVKDLLAGSGSSSPSNLILVPGTDEILFCGLKADGKFYFYRSDGTSAGTQELGIGSGCSSTNFYPSLPNKMIIRLMDSGNYKDKLYAYDSVSKTTTLITPTYTTDLIATGSGTPNSFYYSSRLNVTIFATMTGTTLKFWKTDGTLAGTVSYHSITITGGNYNISNFVDLGSKIVFMYKNSTSGNIYELWETDGTAAGTLKIKTLPGIIGNGILYGGKYIFSLNDGVNGSELWQTDGTSAGTSMIKDINSGSASSNPASFKIFSGKVYFTANDGVHGTELWRTDGTLIGTEMVYDINPGEDSSTPTALTVLNGKLYFKATKILSGQEVWVYSP